MRIQVWGCLHNYPKSELATITFEGDLGVECVRVITGLELLSTERILRFTIRHKDREESPIWMKFQTLKEAEKLQEFLTEAIEAYKKGEDYEGGSTPRTWVIG